MTVLLARRRGLEVDCARFLDNDGAVTAANAPSDWSGHVIVCGLEGVGLRTVEQLRATGVAVVVVDDDPGGAAGGRWSRAGAVPTSPPRGSLEDELRGPGCPAARALVCTSASDLRNVETALLARDLRADIDIVAHLDNPTVGRAVEEATGEGAPSTSRGCSRPR